MSWLMSIPLSLDAFFSLPVVSYLILPYTYTSWSTSLNLLFFTITWATICWSFHPLTVEFATVLAVRIIFYLIPCAVFLSFDTGLRSVSQSIKAHGARAHPARALGIAPDSSAQHKTLVQLVGLAAFNTLLGVVLQAAIEFLVTDLLHIRSAVRISAALPAPWTLVKDLASSFAIRGTVAYYVHRFLLHSRQHSPGLTKAHRAFAHSLRTTLPFAAAYDHPAAYLVHRWLPVYLPAILFRLHLLTYLAFLALISLEEALVFSGYTVLPSTILLAGMARRQEKHIESGGRGNFAPYGFLDFAHGTTIGDTDVMDDVRDEAAKRDVKGKANRAMNAAGDAARGAAGHALDGLQRDRHAADEDDDDDYIPQPEVRNANGGGRRRRRAHS